MDGGRERGQDDDVEGDDTSDCSGNAGMVVASGVVGVVRGWTEAGSGSGRTGRESGRGDEEEEENVRREKVRRRRRERGGIAIPIAVAVEGMMMMMGELRETLLFL